MIALPFVRPLFWATLAAIMFQPLYQWLFVRMGNGPNRAAIATLLIITVAVLIPAFFIGGIIIDQAVAVFLAFQDGKIDVAAWFMQVHDALPAGVQSTLDSSGFANLDSFIARAQDFARESTGVIAQSALAIGSSAFGFVLAFGVGLYATYFLLRDGRSLGEAVVAGLPIERGLADRLAEKFTSIVRATVKGSIVVGLVQGALGAITFSIAGVPSAALFGLLMAIFSLLPALGPALVWIPVAIYLLAIGEIWQGVIVIGSGVLIIGMADNVLRPILVGRDTGIPDWIILVTTLGGIGLLGLSGIVVGPLLAGLFLAGWAILQEQREAKTA
ncbi:AI-2E family transporter [Altererythrobacter gangjinensis]|uniref:AI-2E family transporter n=2 Tax=Pontixanthobacter gangjinensis TaxID=1028742 RepID=A0A6I4SK00_9SPHN|nr:AI-2E family transporter [Pontixanthobacter gangjinensis]